MNTRAFVSSRRTRLPPMLPDGQLYLERLSTREREVVDLVFDGCTNKAIGQRLCISTKTVEKHRASAMAKMQVESFAALIRLMCRELGWQEKSPVPMHGARTPEPKDTARLPPAHLTSGLTQGHSAD